MATKILTDRATVLEALLDKHPNKATPDETYKALTTDLTNILNDVAYLMKYKPEFTKAVRLAQVAPNGLIRNSQAVMQIFPKDVEAARVDALIQRIQRLGETAGGPVERKNLYNPLQQLSH